MCKQYLALKNLQPKYVTEEERQEKVDCAGQIAVQVSGKSSLRISSKKNSVLQESAAYSTGGNGNKRQTEPSRVPRQERSNECYAAMTLPKPVRWHLAKNLEDE